MRTSLIFFAVVSLAFVQAQNWTELQQLLPPNNNSSPIGGQSDEVGRSVDVSGDYAAVGAPHSDVNGSSSGLVVIYEKAGGTWSSVAQLVPADGAEDDLFGWSLSIDGDRLLIGAPGDSPLAGSSGSAYVFERSGGAWTEISKLIPSSGASDHQFGSSVSLDGDAALVGAYGDNTFGVSSGAAFVFELEMGSWVEKAKLTPFDGAANDRFAFSVALSDTLAVCGSLLHDAAGNGAGAVYTFSRNGGTWPLFEKILAFDAASVDRFGASVAIDDGRLAIGATREDDGATNGGSVYMYDHSVAGFVYDDKLLASDAGAVDEFGISVDIDGDLVIVGAHLDDDNGSKSGSAYIFEKTTSWAQVSKLTPNDGAAEDRFAFDVGISGDQAIGGARFDDDSGINSGSVYIFHDDGTSWSQEYKGLDNDMIDDPSLDNFGSAVAMSWNNAVVGSSGDDDFGPLSGSVRFYSFDGTAWQDQGKYYGDNAMQSLNFGHSLAISGERAAIGAYGDNTNGSFAGGVYIFEKSGSTWSQVQKLNAGDGAPFDNFGFSVAMDGDVLVVGAYLDDDDGSNSGSVYIYRHNGTQWTLEQKIGAVDGSVNKFFGRAVSVSGNMMVIGARQDSEQVSNGGAAYVFEYAGGTWTQSAKVQPDNPTINKLFGQSVSAYGNSVMIGASGDPGGGSNAGAVYVYEGQSSWAQTQKLKANVPNESEFFGFSVDHTSNRAVVGAYRAEDENEILTGTAYVFEHDGTSWLQVDSLYHTDGQNTDYFGISVALTGETALIGAQFDDDNGNNAGSAFIFSDCLDADTNGVCDFQEIVNLNDICDSAIAITPSLYGTPSWQVFSLLGASESLEGCSGDADDDVWFKFTAVHSNDRIMAEDSTSMVDLVIEVFDGCGGASLGCFDNYGIGLGENAIPGGLIPGNEYVFRVYDKATGLPATTSFKLQIKTFAFITLRNKFCGAFDYALDDVLTPERQDLNEIYPFTTVHVSGYELLFIDQSTQDSIVHQQTGFSSHFFHLVDVSGLQLNHTYTVKAKHRLRTNSNGVNDYWWSDYGNGCSIGFAGPVETQVVPSFCGNTEGYDLSDIIQAYNVAYADLYRFTLMGGGETLVEDMPSYTLFLNQVDDLQFATTYSVTVQARVNGLWSAPGPACSIEMDAVIPTTALQDQYCDGTFEYPSAQYLLADQITGAESYQWRFTPMSGGVDLLKVTNGLSIAFHTAGLPFVAGETYSVAVRVKVAGVWGAYSDVCDIRLLSSGMAPPQSEEIVQNEFKFNSITEPELKLWPNPSDGEFLSVSLDGEKLLGTKQLDIFDGRGVLVFSETIKPLKGHDITSIALNSKLAPGLYVVILTLSDSSYVSRLLIK